MYVLLLLLLLYTCFRYYFYTFLSSSTLVLIANTKDTLLLLDIKSWFLSSFCRGDEAVNSVFVFYGIIKRIHIYKYIYSEPSEIDETYGINNNIILHSTKFNLSCDF